MRVSSMFLPMLLSVTAAGRAVCQIEPARASTPGMELRLQLVDSTVLVGRVIAWEPRMLQLNEIDRRSVHDVRLVRRSLPMDSVAAAWLRSGTRWKLGGAVGGVVGASGMLLAVNVASGQDGASCSAWCYTSGAAVGAMAGALIGALVGYQVVVWQPVRF